MEAATKPLYFIVHGDLAYDPDVVKEIERIKNEEEFQSARFAGPIPSGMPMDREIRVCGAFGEICVETQRRSFESEGYKAVIYNPATQWTEEYGEFEGKTTIDGEDIEMVVKRLKALKN